ncbi:LysR substrate-binding domain-containing protein [Amycolatopsis sp. H20-H5]|uniref:LysR substrate-binding domain-containing protein n=1 Tax=Amycolatopsis sp. H20-H5 TaxID=3046309 RepID=UPI002DBA7C18|nr:LysR substrate-binding domain-containing protein [Amycolatopsis sp. H20-H5]MEC3974975.1 LysR substrate-binding domain-containing protein [Amycolatopsis sp. H20-H5]
MPDKPRPLRFGYHGFAGVPEAIAHAAREAGTEVELIEYAVDDPFRLLRSGELDLMIAKFCCHEPDLATSATLMTDARAAVVGASHPLSGRDSVSIEEVAAYDGFECPGTMPGYVWDTVVPRRTPGGRPIRRRYSVRSTQEMMELVSRGEAVHISLLSLAAFAPHSVRVVPIHDLPPAPVFLTWCREPGAPGVRAFVARAEAEMSAAPVDVRRTHLRPTHLRTTGA